MAQNFIALRTLYMDISVPKTFNLKSEAQNVSVSMVSIDFKDSRVLPDKMAPRLGISSHSIWRSRLMLIGNNWDLNRLATAESDGLHRKLRWVPIVYWCVSTRHVMPFPMHREHCVS